LIVSTALRRVLLLILAFSLSLSSFSQRRNKQAKEKDPEQLKIEVEYLFVEAEKLYLLKNYSQATELLNKCLSMQPDNDVFYFKKAEISNETEQYEQAAGQIEKALELNSSNKYYYLLAIDIYSNQADLQTVAATYETLIKEVPGTSNYLFNLAATYLYLQEVEKALDAYSRAQARFGLTEEIAFQKQKIYLQLDDLEAAINIGRDLMSTFPDNPKYVLITAEILSSNNRLDESAEMIKTMLEVNPDVPAARLQLASVYWKQNNFTEFEKELILAFRNPDLNVNAKINLVMKYMVYLPNVHLDTLIPSLTTILTEVHPDDRNAYLLAGDVYSTYVEKNLVAGEQKEKMQNLAVKYYSRFVSMDPSNFAVWQNLLNYELQLEAQDSLAIHAEQALELFPNQAWLYLINGIAKHNKKDLKNATQLLEMGAKRATGNRGLLLVIYGYLGDIYNEMKDYPSSDAAYNKVLEIDPQNFTVLNNYSYYLSLRGEKLEQARKMCTTLIQNNPDNTTYLDTYAWVLYTMGEYLEAKRLFEKIILLGVNEGVYYDHYGDTLYRLGEVKEAVKQWKKARELDSSIENIDEKINQGKIIQ
jgi:tetratricopeptide (TPR) repeat protein